MTVVRTRLLCVDDEQLVLSALTRLFRGDCDVVTANSGEEALRLVRDGDFHVVVSDQRMPGMKGVDLLRQIKDIAPQTMRILLTGYSDLGAIVDSVNDGEVFRYITKPWKNDALRYTVQLAAKASIDSALDVHQARQNALALAATLAQPVPEDGGGVVVDLLPPVPVGPNLNAAALAIADLAALAEAAAAPPPAAAPTTLSPADANLVDVLLIDADALTMQQVLEACDDGRHVYRAATLDAAVSALETHDSIGVIITEVHIGADDVTQLLGLLKRHHPSIVTIVASGYSDANVIIKLINQGQIFRFIGKPFGTDRVRDTVQRASKLHRSMQQFSSLAARHSVEDESAAPPSGFAATGNSAFGDSGFGARGAHSAPAELATLPPLMPPLMPPLTPHVAPGLLSRILGLFKKSRP
jgi:response regulator RpfG family c-di-GMP phosphodiesterase